MKTFCSILCAVCGLILFSTSGASAQAWVGSWGGTYEQAQWHGMFRDWQKQNPDSSLQFVPSIRDAAKLELEDRENRIGWDLIDLERDTLDLACDAGLLQPLNLEDYVSSSTRSSASGLNAGPTVAADFVTACGIPSVIWARGMGVHQPKGFENANPPNLRSLFSSRGKTDEQKLALVKNPEGLLELVVMAQGVSPAKVYTTLSTNDGVNLALSHLAQIWPQIVWVDRYQEAFALLKRRDVEAAMIYQDQILPMTFANASRWRFVLSGHLREASYWAIAQKAPDPDMSRSLLKAATMNSAVAKMATILNYTPAQSGALSLMDPTLADRLAGNPAYSDDALHFDASWWKANSDRVVPLFDYWFATMVRGENLTADEARNPFLE